LTKYPRAVNRPYLGKKKERRLWYSLPKFFHGSRLNFLSFHAVRNSTSATVTSMEVRKLNPTKNSSKAEKGYKTVIADCVYEDAITKQEFSLLCG
jgi:hypothetical protein